MRILVIGGTALTGPHVIRELVAHDLFVMSRTGRQILCETALRGDHEDSGSLRDAIKAARPDLVIDMVPFTRRAAEAFVSVADLDMPVVALSSIDVYAAYGRLWGTEPGPVQPTPLVEDAALRTKIGHDGPGYDKTGIEAIYRAAFPNLTILRMPVIYGWPDVSRLSPYLDQMLDGARDITIASDRMTFRCARALHINAAHAVVLAALAATDGQHIYNVAEEKTLTELEWAQRLADLCGWRGKFVAGPQERNGAVQHLEASSAAIRRDLGYHEVADPEAHLAEAIRFASFQRRGGQYVKGY